MRNAADRGGHAIFRVRSERFPLLLHRGLLRVLVLGLGRPLIPEVEAGRAELVLQTHADLDPLLVRASGVDLAESVGHLFDGDVFERCAEVLDVADVDVDHLVARALEPFELDQLRMIEHGAVGFTVEYRALDHVGVLDG